MRAKKVNRPIFWLSLSAYQSLGALELFTRGVLEGTLEVVCLYRDPGLSWLRSQGINVFSLEEKLGSSRIPHNTGHLLAHPLVLKHIKKQSKGAQPAIAYFKPSPKIDKIIKENGWLGIGNSSLLNKKFEDKVAFYRLLKKNNLPAVEGEIVCPTNDWLKAVVGKFGFPLVVSQSRGWAGKGSLLVKNEKELLALAETFSGGRELLVSRFVEGTTLINNACAFLSGKVVLSPPAIQISGISLLSSNPLSTCGRQWPAQGISEKTLREISKVTVEVGRLMLKSGYRGYFGLDFILEKGSNRLYLLECNPRLTASFVFYNWLELEAGIFPLLAGHILSFLTPEDHSFLFKTPLSGLVDKIVGGELVQRNIFPSGVTIPQNMKSGFYDYEGKLVSNDPFLKNEGSGVIFFTREHSIKTNDEVFRIMSQRAVFDPKEKRLVKGVNRLRTILLEKISLFPTQDEKS
jgi:predicted ATP-grasp superfamily ATP-dependent carboligase